MKFSNDFRIKVRKSIELLKEANAAVRNGSDATYEVCAYNSSVLALQQEYGGEWMVFRNKAFVGGFGNDGYMDSRGGTYNPFRHDLPRKRSLAIDTARIACAA